MRVSTIVLALVLSCLAPQAWAGPREEAQRLLKEGRALLKKGDYSQAVIVLMKAQGTYPSAEIQLEIAAAYEGMGSEVDAAQLYEELRAGEALFGKDKERCEKRLAELRTKLGRLVIRCRVKDAEVTVNGKEVGKTPLLYPVYVEPGDVTVTVKTPAREVKQDHTLAAGQEKRLEISMREPPKAAAAAQPAAPSLPPPSALPPPSSDTAQRTPAAPTVRKATAPAPRPARDERRGWLLGRSWTWVAAAGTLVVGAVGVGIGVSAQNDYSTYKDPETPLSQHAGLEDDISAKATTANVMFGVAGALAVTTVVLFFVEGMMGRRGARATLAPTPGGGQLVLGSSF
jgi:hypothetical protein